MSEIKVDRRKVQESEVKQKLKNGTEKIYPQYRITLPKEFVEEHGKEVYLLADSIGIIAPDKETLLKILETYPNLRKFALKLQKKRRRKQK